MIGWWCYRGVWFERVQLGFECGSETVDLDAAEFKDASGCGMTEHECAIRGSRLDGCDIGCTRELSRWSHES